MSKPSTFLSHKLQPCLYPDGKGRGLVAAAPVFRGETLVIFGGSVVRYVEVMALPEDERRLVVQVDEDAFLWSAKEGPGDWLNHSCAPNAGLQGQIVVVAMRDILVGEAVCYDYAMSDGCSYDEFVCHCGAPECRGFVSGDDWRRPELMRRYRGFYSPYLQRRIAAMRRRGAMDTTEVQPQRYLETA